MKSIINVVGKIINISIINVELSVVEQVNFGMNKSICDLL